MNGLLRKLAAYLCKPIYILIRDVYYIFYNLANTRFLNSDVISQFSSNIYVLVSVVMLFAFSVVILSAIVNPDLLNDNKKGVTALFKRAIIALVLMVSIPFMFSMLYKAQENIMDNSLIEKIIIGSSISCQESESTDDSESKCQAGGNGGQVIAGTLLQAVLYPVADDIKVDEDVSEIYTNTIVENIDYMGKLAGHINATTDGGDEGWFADEDTNYAFKFNGLLAIVCGLACVYILVIFSMDIAVRVFKLAFMELTAPISIVGYIAAGNKILSSWFQELVRTYVDLFVRIAIMAFYIFLVSNLPSFLKSFDTVHVKGIDSTPWHAVLQAFLIVGMLIFVKQLPDLINKVFGTNIKLKGGIGGRLGEMAAVGKQAQKAWGAVKQIGKLGAGVAALGAAALANPLLAAGVGLSHRGWNKGFGRFARAGKETAPGKVLSGFGKTAGAYLRGNGLMSGYKDAQKAYSESEFGIEHTANKAYKKSKKIDELFNKKMGNDENGMITDANLAYKNLTNNSKKDLGKVRGQAVNAMLDANIQKAKVEKITSDKDAIVSSLDTLRANAKTAESQNAISDLKNNLLTGKYSIGQFRNELNSLIDKGIINGTDGGTISSKMDSITNKINSDSDIASNLIGENDKLIFGASGLGKITTFVNSKAANAKATYDNLYKGSSETMKQEMDKYSTQSEQIVTETVKAAHGSEGKVDHKKDKHYQAGYSGPSNTNTTENVEFSTLQENIDKMVGIHDAPTREEHIGKQDYYNSIFNSDVGSRYLDANEREDDRIHGTPYGNNTTNSGVDSSNVNANNTNTNGSSSSVNVEGLEDLFNNLNKTITDTSDSTNKILQDQLNEQKNMSSELKNQTNGINNVDDKLNEFKNNVSNGFDDIKKKMDDSNK